MSEDTEQTQPLPQPSAQTWEPPLTPAPPDNAPPWVWIRNHTLGFRALAWQQNEGRNHVNELQITPHRLTCAPGLTPVGAKRWAFFAKLETAVEAMRTGILEEFNLSRASSAELRKAIADTGNPKALELLLETSESREIVELARVQLQKIGKMRGRQRQHLRHPDQTRH